MALRITSYGSRGSLSSFIKGVVNRQRAYKDADMSYQYSTGKMTPEDYLKYVETRLAQTSSSSTDRVTWQKRYDSVVTDMTDDRAKNQYTNGDISPAEYADYIKTEMMPRYVEGSPLKDQATMRINQLMEEQQRKDESDAKAERSDYRMKKLYEISQMGDDSGAKIRAKMDMYQTLATEALNDGDEGAYYRAATAYNNAMTSYQSSMASASAKAQATEKKALNQEKALALRNLDILINNGADNKAILAATDKYLGSVLKAANSGVYDEAGMTSLQNELNDMGYSGGSDPNSGIINLGEYGGTSFTRTDSKRLKAVEAAAGINAQVSPDNQSMFGGETRFGEGGPRYGEDFKTMVNEIDSALGGGLKDEAGNAVDPYRYVGQKYWSYNGLTGKWETQEVTQDDLVSGKFNPKNVWIDITGNGGAYTIFTEPTQRGGILGSFLDKNGIQTSGKRYIIAGKDASGKPIKIYLSDTGDLANQSDYQLLANSEYSKSLQQLGKDAVYNKQQEEIKAEQERHAKEMARVAEEIAKQNEAQRNFDANQAANRPLMAAPAAAPTFNQATAKNVFASARAGAGLPAVPMITPKAGFADLTGKAAGFVSPTALLGGQIPVASGYYKVAKGDGGYDFVKQGFGNISVDDMARETGIPKEQLLR